MIPVEIKPVIVRPVPPMFYFDPPARVELEAPPLGAASFRPKSHNRKLSPVDLVQFPGQPRLRPIARAPFVSSTYASIAASCPSSCAFYRSGCFADSGFTKMAGQAMDHAARGRSPIDVARAEALLIRAAFGGGQVPQDGARGGRDLRLHVGGDARTAPAARELAGAAADWRARGGGAVWTFTHAWRTVPRSAWGPAVSVLASIEHPSEVEDARKQGYPSAIVVEAFDADRTLPLDGAPGHNLIPCPAETRGATCASCRLCLDRDLLSMRAVIGFAAHGTGKAQVVDKLVQIGRRAR